MTRNIRIRHLTSTVSLSKSDGREMAVSPERANTPFVDQPPSPLVGAPGVHFTVEGPPVPWARARLSKGRHFTAEAQAAHMRRVAWAGRRAIPEPLKGPLLLSASFFIEPPRSWSGVKRRRALGLPVIVKPDLSNLIKIIEDALNGIAYIDDNQVAEYGLVAKTFSLNPRTEIHLLPLPGLDD